MKIPKRLATIKKHIKKYEKYLLSEKRKYGWIDDSSGIRYIIGPYYMIAGDLEGALKHFKWYKKNFSDDMGSPEQYLCWTLALYMSGDLEKAYTKFLQLLFMNPYVITKAIGSKYASNIKVCSNIDAKEWTDYVPDEIYKLWDEDSKIWLKESFNKEKTQSLLAHYNEIEKKIETLAVGPERSKLIDELYAMKLIVEV